MKKHLFFLSIFVLLLNHSVFSQKNEIQKWAVNFPENVNAPLTSKENKMIQEAFGMELRDKIISNHSRLSDIKDILRNRVEIFDAKQKNISSIMNLSNIPLFDSSIPPKSFNLNNFNPLVYKFDFYIKSTQIYRVDNTSYLIFIHPRNLK